MLTIRVGVITTIAAAACDVKRSCKVPRIRREAHWFCKKKWRSQEFEFGGMIETWFGLGLKEISYYPYYISRCETSLKNYLSADRFYN